MSSSSLKLSLIAVVLGLVLSFAVAHAYAAQVQTTLDVAGLPQVVVTAQAQTATVLATNDDSPSKSVHVISCTTVDGYPFVLLLRVQNATNGLFIDVIGEASIGELTTRVTAMTITGSSHPSTAKDAIDTAVLADAVD